MIDDKKLKQVYSTLKQGGYNEDFNTFKSGFTGNNNYANRKQVYDLLSTHGANIGSSYEEFMQLMQKPKAGRTPMTDADRARFSAGTPTVNKYRQQMLNSVDPTKNRASELTKKAVGQAKRATNTVRKPVTAKVVDQKGKPTGQEFAITPAKTVEDLDREYAKEVSNDWENELNNQIADADNDAAKISSMFKSFIGNTDEVGGFFQNITRGGGIAGTPHSVTTNNGMLENTEARQLMAAGNYNRERKRLLQLEKDTRNGAWLDDHSFWRGLMDAAKDHNIWTGNAGSIIDTGTLLATRQDLEKGKHTETGDLLLSQVVKNADAQGQYGDNQGWMYAGGVITTNMVPFITQIASAGFSEAMSQGIGKAVQGVASAVGKATMKKTAGLVGAEAAKYIGKFTGLTTKTFGKALQYGLVGAAQANTVGLGNVANDVMSRYTGQAYQDEQGNYKFGTFDSDGNLIHEGGEDFLTALVKGDTAQTIEFATELAGGGIDAVGGALKKFIANGGKKIINKYNMENVSKVIDFMLNNKLSKNVRFLKSGADRTLGKLEISSIVGESLEEELGIIANSVFTGDNKINDLWDNKQQSRIWGGMLLSMGLMKGIAVPLSAYNAKQYYTYKHKLDKADVNLSQLLGKEKWDELRGQIDQTTNRDMPKMQVKVLRDVALGKNRDAVIEYIKNLLVMRGYDIGNMLAAKNAISDKGKDVTVKNMEKNQAYQQGREANGYDTHEIQIDMTDKQRTLAQLLGITEQQVSAMSDEELDGLTGQNDNLDRAIYEYQLSNTRYEGVLDNAQDQVDIEAQRAAQAVDMYTDKSRGTVRNATIKATQGAEDYNVYIVNGNIATHDDGTIDVGNSDDMILYFDPTTGKIEHTDALRFAALGSEENADDVRNQAVADAKEKAIKEISGIIDGRVDVGTQFMTTDEQGNEHTYEVLADNGDGTVAITIDGNVEQNPYTLEQLQQMKDIEDQKRLEAAKAEREQMEAERNQQAEEQKKAEEQNDAQLQAAYNNLLDNDGNVVMATVHDGKHDEQQAFVVGVNQANQKPFVVFLNEDGTFTKPRTFDAKKVEIGGNVDFETFKALMPTSSVVEDNSGDVEVNEPQPIGTGVFGNIYNQFKGKVKEAFNFLMNHQSGDLLGVFHRDDVGDIDLVWGNEKMGLAHILGKHVGEGKDFETPDDAINMIDEVIKKGRIFQDTENRYTLMLDGIAVGIRKNFDGEKKNWIVTAVDFNRTQEEKGIATNPTSTSHGAMEPESAAALNDSQGKDTNISSNDNGNNTTLTFEDGTPVPMREDGNPDFSQMTAAQTAELYDNQFGEDAEQVISGWVSDAKKALDKANNMTVKGKNFVEQKASKDAKEKAIAEAQTAYESAVAIRDAYNERQLNKGLDTHDGRMNLIEKARRKFNRLKSSVKNDAEATLRLYQDTVGSLLHRLYDGTGIDVFDDTPHTVDEYVASSIAPYSLNYEGNETSKGVKQETGLSRQDFAKLGYLAAAGKGTTIDAMVHSLWEGRPSNFENADTQEIRNALLAHITSGQTAFESRNYIQNSRIAEAENALEEQKRAGGNTQFAEETQLPNEEIASEETTDSEISQEETPEVPEDATDEAPLGEQLNESDLPFSAKNDTERETAEDRAANVERNKVEDTDVVDAIVGKKTRKALERIAKMMGAKIQYQYTDKLGNGWYDNATNTIYLTLDSSIIEGVQFIFGHEMTHEIKTKNAAAYDELYQLVKDMMGEDAFNAHTAEVRKKYNDAGVMYASFGDYEEEVVADQIGYWLRDLNYAHTLAMKMSHPLLAKIHEIINRIRMAFYGTEYTEQAKEIMRTIEQAYVKTANREAENTAIQYGEGGQRWSLRTKEAPKTTRKVYKLMRMNPAEEGKLFPLFIGNGEAVELGKWYDADSPKLQDLKALSSKDYVATRTVSKDGKKVKEGYNYGAYLVNNETGEAMSLADFKDKYKSNKAFSRMGNNPNVAALNWATDNGYRWIKIEEKNQGQSRYGGENRSYYNYGINGTGSVSIFAMRPGWHAGSLPTMRQIGKGKDKNLRDDTFVWVEGEISADIDYNAEAQKNADKDIPDHIPTDGYYLKATNANKEASQADKIGWYVAGAFKANRIMSDKETRDIIDQWNAEHPDEKVEYDWNRESGKDFNAETMSLEGEPKFSLKVYHGSGADFTEFDFDHMGEGEGTQAFGWGGYVTSSKKIGKSYADMGFSNASARRFTFKETKEIDERIKGESSFKNISIDDRKRLITEAEQYLKEGFDDYRGTTPKEIISFVVDDAETAGASKEVVDILKSINVEDLYLGERNLYEVNIPDDNGSNYLDWYGRNSNILNSAG